MNSVEVKNLTKSYIKVRALNSVSFEVKKGELFGFIGPDGAGKSSLFRILTTLLKPDEGEGRVEGLNLLKNYKEIRKLVGYMPGRFSLYQDLSVEENLKFFSKVFGTTIKENYDLIKDIYIQIEPFKTRLAGKLSGGMKQKLALSCALIHRPSLLILDEPTTGVDAVSRKEFWEILQKMIKHGITIIVSTPYMDEATLCDRVALIQKGTLLSVDTPENIVNSFSQKLYALKSSNTYKLIEDLKKYEKDGFVYPSGQFVHYLGGQKMVNTQELESYLKAANHPEVIIGEVKPNIEDCFMKLMKSSEN